MQIVDWIVLVTVDVILTHSVLQGHFCPQDNYLIKLIKFI